MSTENAGSATPQENSVPSETPKPTDTVAYDTYKRVLAEAKKLKEQVRQFEEDKNKSQEQRMREQNEWKALAEAKAEQASKLEMLLKSQTEQINNGLKYQEFEKHLGGKLKKQDYATFVDFEKIVLNPETGKVDSESAKIVASEFAKTNAELVDFGNIPRLPNQAASPGSASSSKKIEDMSKTELETFIKEQAKLGLI